MECVWILGVSIVSLIAVFAIAFLAAALLGLRDEMRYSAVRHEVRKHLLNRDDIEDSQFLNGIPLADHGIMRQVRQAVAKFFDVEPAKIHLIDDMINAFHCEHFNKGLQIHFAEHLYRWRGIDPVADDFDPFYTVSSQGTFESFAREMAEVFERSCEIALKAGRTL